MATGTFLDEIALGRTIEGTSPLHRASAGWKALLFALVAVATFFWQSASSFLALGVLLAALARWSGIPALLFWRSLRPVTLLALFTILAGAYLRGQNSHVEGLVFSLQGLSEGGLYAARLFVITLLTTLFFLTTKAADTVSLGIKVLTPLRWLGISQGELSLLVHLAYRFVPLLRREVEEMALGRVARGLPAPKSLVQRAGLKFGQLIHLFVGALQRAETTAMALEQRRVVDGWVKQREGTSSWGWGGAQTALLALTAALLFQVDGLLL